MKQFREALMNLLRNVIRPYLYTRFYFHRMTGTGAFRNNSLRYVGGGVQSHWNSLKQAIWKFHVKQFHEASCSVASVASCLSAVRAIAKGDTVPIGQPDLLERVATGHWKERMSDNGYQGRRGLPLALLGRVVDDSFAAYGLAVRAVETVQIPKRTVVNSPVRRTLKRRLLEFDRHGNGLIVAHFDQGSFIPALNIPHISPVGAYDSATDRVTILDVDPGEASPYELDFKTFVKGLACDYHHVFDAFGYGSGGYVYIRIR
jgi:hypothetical protein